MEYTGRWIEHYTADLFRSKHYKARVLRAKARKKR